MHKPYTTFAFTKATIKVSAFLVLLLAILEWGLGLTAFLPGMALLLLAFVVLSFRIGSSFSSSSSAAPTISTRWKPSFSSIPVSPYPSTCPRCARWLARRTSSKFWSSISIPTNPK